MPDPRMVEPVPTVIVCASSRPLSSSLTTPLIVAAPDAKTPPPEMARLPRLLAVPTSSVPVEIDVSSPLTRMLDAAMPVCPAESVPPLTTVSVLAVTTAP